MIYFLVDCTALRPILKLLRKGVIPMLQIGIVAVLVVLLIIDFGKAVMAGKEDEIKSAQKLAIKRIAYALVVFLVPWAVNLAIGLLANANEATGDPYTASQDAWSCWANANSNCAYGDRYNTFVQWQNQMEQQTLQQMY